MKIDKKGDENTYYKMSRVTEVKNFDGQKMVVRDETCYVSKSDVEYGKIPIMYDGGQFLLMVPKCKTMGVRSREMENGFTWRTMPLVFEYPLTDEQTEFVNVFRDIARNAYEQLVQMGYPESKLSKLESCFWREKILFTDIVESVYYCKNNTRYFMGDEEVGREMVGEGIEYDVNAAVLIDSIYVGARTVSIQVKLYEVSLTPSKKRDRVL